MFIDMTNSPKKLRKEALPDLKIIYWCILKEFENLYGCYTPINWNGKKDDNG
jgi:hypothetical protein